MGDFDRQESGGAKSKDTKKAVLALVLGMVLIGLLANWYLKRTMQPPVAPGSGGAAVPVPIVDDDMSPAGLVKLQAELKNDPTKALLQPKSATVVAVLPRNPFRMSDGWMRELYPPAAPVPTPIAVTPTNNGTPTPPPPVVVQPLGLNPADYKLQSLFSSGAGFAALINSQTVRVGDIVGVAKVLDIQIDKVILQHFNYPDGPKLVLPWKDGMLSKP